MATKKQKRELAEQKRQHMLDELARSNRAALEKDRERRERLKRQAAAEASRRRSSQASRALNAMFPREEADD